MAGELLTGDYQIEWQATLLGAGTNFHIGEAGIGGLGVPQPHTADTDLDHGDGVWLGRDYRGVRVLTIPFVLTGTPTEAATRLHTLSTLWQPVAVNDELHLRLPGFGHISVTGRPRGLTEDLAMLPRGTVEALASFWCGDPTITVVAP